VETAPHSHYSIEKGGLIWTLGQIDLFKFEKGQWIYIGRVLDQNNEMVSRYDFAILDNSAIFVLEMFDPKARICSIVVDITSGETGGLWPFTGYAKFPSVAVVNNHCLAAWVGSSALPLERQGKNHVFTSNNEFYMEALFDVETEVKKILEAMEPERLLTDIIFAGIWSPLWLGLLNHQTGECVKTHGPLGHGGLDNIFTYLASGMSRGLLMWNSDFDDELQESRLMARELGLP